MDTVAEPQATPEPAPVAGMQPAPMPASPEGPDPTPHADALDPVNPTQPEPQAAPAPTDPPGVEPAPASATEPEPQPDGAPPAEPATPTPEVFDSWLEDTLTEKPADEPASTETGGDWINERVDDLVKVVGINQETGEYEVELSFPGPNGTVRKVTKTMTPDRAFEKWAASTWELEKRDLQEKQTPPAPAAPAEQAQDGTDIFATDFTDVAAPESAVPQDQPPLPLEFGSDPNAQGIQPQGPQFTPLQANADPQVREQLARQFDADPQIRQWVMRDVAKKNAMTFDEMDPDEARRKLTAMANAQWDDYKAKYVNLETPESQAAYGQSMRMATSEMQQQHERALAHTASMLGNGGGKRVEPIRDIYRNCIVNGARPVTAGEQRVVASLLNPFLGAAYAFHRPDVTAAEARGFAKGMAAAKGKMKERMPALMEKMGVRKVAQAPDAQAALLSRTGGAPVPPGNNQHTTTPPPVEVQSKDHLRRVDAWRGGGGG